MDFVPWKAEDQVPTRTHQTPIRPTEDLHVLATIPVVSPQQIKVELPMSAAASQTVVKTREAIKAILHGDDSRVLVIAGPCSIHDEEAALDYATRLHRMGGELADRLVVVMRVYFEKPRTTVGWKGLIYDPLLNGTFEIEQGLHRARKLLLQIADMGLGAATEFLDPIVPQYIADLVAWAAIGARTTESQTHRQMASGLSMPVGYKNSTEGNLQVAIDAMKAAAHSHSFMGIDDDGRTAVIKTRGNPWGHVVLRGGRERPNYDPESIADAVKRLKAAGLSSHLMVDCSHANSGKQHQRQETVFRSAVEQRTSGNRDILGLLLESNINEGSQPLTEPGKLQYGVSITDECIGWEKTEELLCFAHQALKG